MNTLSLNQLNIISAGDGQSEYMELEVELANWNSLTADYGIGRDNARLTRFLSTRSRQMSSTRTPDPVR